MATLHFTDLELACRCGCGGLPPEATQAKLEALRVAWGKPMRLSSAFRCPSHNVKVSKSGPNGPHTLGAFDVQVNGEDAFELVKLAMSMGWTGIGLSQKGALATRFIHIDAGLDATHPRPRLWSY